MRVQLFNRSKRILIEVLLMPKTLEELGQTEISELINRRVSIFTPEDTVSSVRGELLKTGRYEAIVSGGGKVGLVTIRDLLNAEQQEQKLERIWTSQSPVTSDSWVKGVASELVRINLRALPVVENMKPVGIISQVDIIEALADCPTLRRTPAKDLAKMPLITLDFGEKIAEARRLMLEKGFSHVPILKDGKLVGIVTAQDIVQTFSSPSIGRSKTGEKQGEKINRYPGAVSGIMDKTPLTVGLNASALDVAKGIRDHKKSACLIVDNNNVVHGIITPRELLELIAEPVVEPELPISIVGITGEDFFERAVAEEKVRRVVERGMRMHPEINEVSIVIKKTNEGGERSRYQISSRVLSPREQFNVSEEGWDLLETFDSMLNALGKGLTKAKRDPQKFTRRGRGRESS
jgi:predicted transcriptional regulator/ribosome-associated translation inhibitor RaiA